MVNMNENENEELEEITDENIETDELEIDEIEEQTAAKLKKMRDKLARCDEEKKQALDDLQRAKAEFLNARKRLEDERIRDRVRYKIAHTEELLPLCDSFQMAMSNVEVWEKADKAWRMGIEGINTQLMQILSSYGVKALDPTGESFDPYKHEAIGTEGVQDKEQDHKVLKVIQRGYEMTNGDKTEIIRPARVIIGEFKN